MIVAIGARFHFEYKNSEDKNNMNGNNDTEIDMDSNTSRDKYLPSGQLWYMIIFTYFIPVVGMFMFFVVHHYWTQKSFVISSKFWNERNVGRKEKSFQVQ